MTYIDIEPDPAASAARNTAATAPTWESWASTSEQTLRTTATSAKDSVVTTAFETYLQDLNPRIKSMADLAEKQGVDLGWAVQYAIDGDDQAAADQRPAEASATNNAPALRRPVNVE
ncbi:MAG: hypothetical protein L0K86_16490 [Actinomycetia bacterium]|nr:hypothetical protein [Actinomycetes bacterium]